MAFMLLKQITDLFDRFMVRPGLHSQWLSPLVCFTKLSQMQYILQGAQF